MKRSAIILIALAIILTTLGLGGKALCEEAKVTVKIADHFPVAHLVPTTLTKPWIARVEALTKGKAKFQYFPAQQLVPQTEALPALQRKIVDIALVNLGLFPTEFPLSGVLFLPSGYDSSIQGGRAVTKMFEFNPILQEFSKAGVSSLLPLPLDAYEILTTKKKLVKMPDDVKGLKIRPAGEAQVWAIRQLGGTPVNMPAPDIYTGMQRGTLDGSLFSISLAKSYKMNEVTKYSTYGAKVGYATIIYCVNNEFWKNLNPDIKEAMLQASSEALPIAWKALDDTRKSVREEFEKTGVVFPDITADIQAVWKEKLEPVRSQWAAAMKTRGLPGNDVLAEWDKVLAATK